MDPFRASEASEATGNVVVTALDEQPGGTGPLAGWRVGVKDDIGVAGVRSTCGSAFSADHVAPADAEVVTRLRAAGPASPLTAAAHADDAVCAAGAWFQPRTPWHEQRPPSRR